MSLNDAVQAELPFLRAEAEARMTSRATIRRLDGHAEVNRMREPNWVTVATAVPVRLAARRGAASSSTASIGTTITEVDQIEAHLPVATDLAAGDLLEVVGEHSTIVLRVVAVSPVDQATALRVPVVSTPRPKEWPS